MSEELIRDEVSLQALRELAEIAAELKKSGLLGWIREFLGRQEELLAMLEQDAGILRLTILLAAILEAARGVDASKVASLKINLEKGVTCLLDGLSSVDPAEAKPRGLTGLMGALRDPDVQKGLGFLMDLAKALGACLNKRAAARS